MKRILLKGCVAAMLPLLMAGCSKFSDINTNPNTTTEVSASLLCTNVVLKVARFGGADAKAYIAENALSKYVGYANEGQLDAQYNRLGNGSFDVMTVLPNIDNMLAYAKGSVMENSYKGVAAFVRAFMFYKLTMEMGDIPYSATNRAGEGAYRPAYDAQADVFKGILDELKAADQYFANGQTFTGDPTAYNGDPAKWRRATNAFALKVLMSLSKKTDNTTLNVAGRFADIVKNGYLLESGTGYWGLKYSTQNRHPLYSTNDMFTGRTLLGAIVVDELKSLGDRRLFYLANPSLQQIAAGKTESDFSAYAGIDVSVAYDTMNARYSRNEYSIINTRYQKEDATEPRRLLSYAEQQLILAEAAVRGWITTGLPKTYYEQGVADALAAFKDVNTAYAHGMAINDAYINSYFTGGAAFKSDTQAQLQQIWMQRYLLNFLQDGETAYFEYRRNSYPAFPVNPASSMNTNNPNAIPMRWLYPSSETNYNRENLVTALNRQYEGYDEINKLMWLLK